ncbi:MAG: sulfatase [Bacteroidota bacterium]
MKSTAFLVGFLSFFFMACQPPAQEEAPQRPNILFIMADDHAQRAISAYTDELIQTPNLDRIAKDGMLFRNSFVTNSICAPSRAAILSGKYSHINGKLDNLDTFDGDQWTFIKELQSAGYYTSVIGKWHLKSAPQGFDNWHILIDQGDYYSPEFVHNGDTLPRPEGYTTSIITDLALEELKTRSTQSEEPFCMLYWHKAPHRNWMPDLQDLPGLTEKEYPEPANLRDTYEGRPAAEAADMRVANMFTSMDHKLIEPYISEDENSGGQPSFNPKRNWERNLDLLTPAQREAWEPFLQDIGESYQQAVAEGKELEWRYQRYMQDYLASIASVDRNVGRVLDYLDESGLAENTLVIYTSDQGFYLGEHGWYDKRFMYEESHRTPLMIRYPAAVQANSTTDELVLNIDLGATLLDFAGLNIPEAVQGRSLRPLLEAQSPDDWRKDVYYRYYEYPHGWHAVAKHEGVRGERYKLIHFTEPDEFFELYDLETDPTEMNNRYDDPALAEVQAELMERLSALRQELQVPD